MFTGDDFGKAAALTAAFCIVGILYLTDPAPPSESLYAHTGGIMIGFGLGVFATVLYVRRGGFRD